MIELYIENKKIDLSEDFEINFNYETINPDKLSSIKNNFSKTVNIPGTPNNNITFGHIFRIDKYIPIAGPSNINSYYDPHKKINWFINKNGSVINRGYCTLDNILIKDKNDITYQFTLYGGIGEFFYSLSYNEDGTNKTLKDIWFNWKPKTGLYTYGQALNQNEENVNTLMSCSADMVASSWHNLNPYYTYEGSTDFDKDVVFVPSYCGQYEDFDSKHMIVSTFNQNYYGSTFMDTDTRNKLKSTFPDKYTEDEGTADEKNYYTIGRNLSHTDTYKYGLVTFSRDIDPYEAGDLRVNELPVALRLSKLMASLSNPVNNGGYNVIWDSEILNSPYWMYSWILLGKLQQPKDNFTNMSFEKNETYDGQQTKLRVSYYQDTQHQYQYNGAILLSGTTTYQLSSQTNTLPAGKYNMVINVFPKWEFDYRKYDNGWNYNWNDKHYDFISGYMKYTVGNNVTSGNFQWVTPILIHRIYDNGVLLKTICDIFYYTTNLNWSFGKNPRTNVTTIKTLVQNWIQNNMTNSGETISNFYWHNCKISNPQEEEVDSHSYITCILNNEKIITPITLSSDSSNIYVTEEQNVVYTKIDWTNQGSGTSVNSEVGIFNTNPEYVWLLGFVRSDYKTYNTWDLYHQYKYSFNLNESMQNGFNTQESSGFNIIKLTKDLLFANSDTPMKYMTDFCKALNLKFICDNTTKTIWIKTLKNYYINSVIDINDKVDISRNINMKPVITKYKRINLGFDTPDTYPVSLFNKLSEAKFNTNKYDTGVEFSTLETDILKDSIYKNTIDWQQSSVFYNIYPQYPRAYDTPTVSWTLFDDSNISFEELNSKEIITSGCSSKLSNLIANIDFYPKPSLFDNSNKEKDAYPSLLFLNGFVKNYNYTKTATGETSVLTPDSINESHYIDSSGNIGNSSYQDIYIYNITNTNLEYKVTASFSSGYGSYTVNYYNSSETRIGTEYLQTSATLVDAVLTIPSGTTSIRCNFRKTDSDAKLTVTSDFYTISPKLTLTNDTVEQYYLTGGRCYMYDFKYIDSFTNWGSYSTSQKGTATSWVLPYFSKDLYNLYNTDVQEWEPNPYIYASWNINYQPNIDSIYSLLETDFIRKPNFIYQRQFNSLTVVNENEYEINNFPVENSNSRIYDLYWKDYLDEMYNRNTRDVTLYVDISKFGDANTIMRKLYAWKSHLWIITKIENYKVSDIIHDKFSKVTLHKIIDKNNWVN